MDRGKSNSTDLLEKFSSTRKVVPARLVGDVRTMECHVRVQVSDSKSVGTATSLSPGLPASLTLWITI